MNRLPFLAGFTATLIATFSNSTLKAQEPRFLGRTRQEWVAAYESGGRRERTHAAWAISNFALEQIGPTNTTLWLNELCLLAESESPSVRYWGVLGLGRLLPKLKDDPTARETTLAALGAAIRDRSDGPRLAAAEALGREGRVDAAMPVLLAAMNSPQEATRIQAITALANLGSAARPALDTLQAATTDPSEYVKRISTRAVAALESQ
jgi:HEAT repeat protein